MPLDVSGALLDGVRISEGNNPYSYPPRDLVSSASSFGAVTSASEYCVISDSSDPAKVALEIADPSLVFRWTKNESVVNRFAYSSFSKRWLPSPGGPPDVLGPLSNEERLVAPIPDLSVPDAPFALYVGSPVRAVTFTVSVVGEESDFSPPSSLSAGTVQLSDADGKLNFSAADVSAYGDLDVLCQRQGFFDASQVTGRLGDLPASSVVDYFLFMNPRPASGQRPLVRIGYGRHMVGVEYSTESALPVPSVGTFAWSLDTGRVVFAPFEVDANAGQGVYYDGVDVGSVSPVRTDISAPSGWPSVAFTVPLDAVGVIDQRYVLFAELGGVRTYWTMIPVSAAPTRAPRTGTVAVRTDTGQAYLSPDDVDEFSGWSYAYLDSLLPIEDGVSVQVFRSGVNGAGVPQVPDFTVYYVVENQVIVDGISQSPFVMLPTVPVTDSSLFYRVEQGPSSSGTFTGELADGKDPDEPGLGYLLDLDRRQFKYCFRKSSVVTLPTATPAVKLAEAAISELGFEASVDGDEAIPGVDFGFDGQTGVITFTEPFGQNDPDDVSGLAGDADGPFLTPAVSFPASYVGRWVLVQSGSNAGIRQIVSVDFGRATVDPPFPVVGSVLFDVRSAADVVVDRVWKDLDPPYKKFSLASGPSASGPFSVVPRPGFSILPSVSQVNLTEPAAPGRSFLATYVGLVTTDDGATFTPTNVVELAAFKVRQETASSTVGSPVVTINPEGRTVDPDGLFAVYVNGVPLDRTFFEFQAPGTLRLTDPVLAGQTVVVDYYVQNALGGETSFDLKVRPMDLDSLQVSAGSLSFSANGDQTGTVSDGSLIWVGGTEAALVAGSSYDSSSDVTTVELVAPMATDSASAVVQACAPVDDYVFETAALSSFVAGSNSLTVGGDVTSSYREGTIVLLSATDAYVVISAQYVAASLSTRVTFSSPARRNYIIPSLEKSARPVYPAGVTFQTSRSADLDFDFQLVRMGTEREVLVRGVDYDVSAGGVITLKEEVVYGDELVALYVAYLPKPAGTVLALNYAYAVAPAQSNGLVGQRLVSDYTLYAPDTFFYRVMTVVSFLPEVQDLLRAGATSAGSSGPNTKDATGMSNKDFGRPSLYYPEQYQHNLDIVTARLLLFYNDFVNLYEDLLSDLDGRVVGGRSGRFRFDDLFDNPPRTAYADVTNDIDDRVKLYSHQRMTGFFTYEDVPVYGTMGTPNSLSRLFPTSGTASFGLNDKTGITDYGNVMGSMGVENLRSVGTITSSRSNEFFSSASGTSYTVEQNGDPDLLLLPFSPNQDVVVYALDGSPDVSGKVVSVSGTGPYTVELDVATSLRQGSIVRDTSVVPDEPGADTNHFYQPGRDLSVDLENGQVENNTLSLFFIPSLGGYQMKIWGNEIVDAPYTFGNPDLSARRLPVLDGSELDDDGRVPVPRTLRLNESSLLEDELTAMGGVGTATSVSGLAKVSVGGVDIVSSTLSVAVGDVIVFPTGPNAGLRRTVSVVLTTTSFRVSAPLTEDVISRSISSLSLLSTTLNVAASSVVYFLDGPNFGTPYAVTSSGSLVFRVAELVAVDPGSHFEVQAGGLILTDVVVAELGVLHSNSAVVPVPPALVAPLDSEIDTIVSLVRYSGNTLASGTGTAAGNTLTDSSAQFLLDGVVAGSLVLVVAGANVGLYKVLTATSHQLTVDGASPFVVFPASGSTSYEVVRPEAFLRSSQWGPLSQELRETWAFYLATVAWLGSISPSGAPARQLAVAARQAQIEAYLTAIRKVLVDGKLYEVRYLWINQRVDRQDGNFVKERQASERRVKNTAKMLADQQKMLVADSL